MPTLRPPALSLAPKALPANLGRTQPLKTTLPTSTAEKSSEAPSGSHYTGANLKALTFGAHFNQKVEIAKLRAETAPLPVLYALSDYCVKTQKSSVQLAKENDPVFLAGEDQLAKNLLGLDKNNVALTLLLSNIDQGTGSYQPTNAVTIEIQAAQERLDCTLPENKVLFDTLQTARKYTPQQLLNALDQGIRHAQDVRLSDDFLSYDAVMAQPLLRLFNDILIGKINNMSTLESFEHFNGLLSGRLDGPHVQYQMTERTASALTRAARRVGVLNEPYVEVKPPAPPEPDESAPDSKFVPLLSHLADLYKALKTKSIPAEYILKDAGYKKAQAALFANIRLHHAGNIPAVYKVLQSGQYPVLVTREFQEVVGGAESKPSPKTSARLQDGPKKPASASLPTTLSLDDKLYLAALEHKHPNWIIPELGKYLSTYRQAGFSDAQIYKHPVVATLLKFITDELGSYANKATVPEFVRHFKAIGLEEPPAEIADILLACVNKYAGSFSDI